MSKGFGKRHPICMVHVGIPLENVNEWNSREEIVAEMKKVIENDITFPENARVQAWFNFLPDPAEDLKLIEVQDGFYKDPYKTNE